jgi:hypothetical protein
MFDKDDVFNILTGVREALNVGGGSISWCRLSALVSLISFMNAACPSVASTRASSTTFSVHRAWTSGNVRQFIRR